ncbi:hypothetical protein [Amantichitinum ursilacus]|uniref:Glycosyltransferase RgtA/B/C/D-like domain-containing protein n=1 Tax=Amantichitinum ursilacus TaxID=857265 RepID=A0A0N0XI29_9NEIS|nr:hypothetical protein [Amantichitinum ursilacus]KPC52265.1 hypothetical protein WG78_14435 [Amantichitinum ursilacus]
MTASYAPDRLCPWLTRAAALYLAAPVWVFLLTWFQPQYGVPLALMLAAGAVLTLHAPLLHTGNKPGWRGPQPLQWLLLIAVVLLWSALGGAGHLFYANAFDWHVRDALLLDLSRITGPLAVQTLPSHESWLLRCPLGYYLVPALFGRFVGLPMAQFGLLLWTALGVFLVMAQLALVRQGWKFLGLLLLLLPLYSGMDWLGGLVLFNPQPLFSTVHIQWWAYVFQYSANSTLLFWVPNHTLPGWLFAVFIYTRWHDPRGLRMLPLWLTVLPLWSPLTTIGTLPFMLVYALKHLRQRQDVITTLKLAPLFIPAAALCAYYLVLDSASVAAMSQPAQPLLARIILYVAFVVFEFVILWALLLRQRRDGLLLTTGAILLILPLFHLGPNNDLVMRASIAPLLVLCIASIDYLAQVRWSVIRERMAAVGVCTVLAIGSITALHEIARAVLWPRWDSPLTLNTFTETQGAAHYFAHVRAPWFVNMLAPINLQFVDNHGRPLPAGAKP